MGGIQGRQTLRVPALFMANRGQADPGVRFMVRTGDVRAWFRPGEIVMEWRKERARLSFPGANPSPEIEGLNPAPANANFLSGPSASSWQTTVPIFRSILYRGIYPGIDMIYGGSERYLKSEFLVAPGADPGAIRLRYEGLGRPSLDAAGALVFRGGEDEFREEAPEAYQEVAGRRVHIDSKYRIAEDDTVAFELGPYDETLPLVIDPVLAFSTYLGGTGFDCVNAVAVDPAGNAYVAGWTESADFPVAAARQGRSGGRVDAFVAKFSPSGALLYATYLGGSGEDRASGIAVDGAGSVTVAGWTYSTDFPVFSATQPRPGGARDVFIARLNAAGTGFVYSTWLGGSGNDTGLGVALDQAGNAFVAGDTMSPNLPVRGAFQSSLRGRQDALLAKFSPTGQLLFCTYLGGSGNDGATAVAVDLFGNPHLTGSTDSVDFPLQNPLQRQPGGGQDAFVTKMAADGGWLFYSTYLGGAGGLPGLPENGAGIAVDQQGNTYVTGTTSSSNFPTAAALRALPAGGGLDAFVSKLNAAGSAFVYSTYLGGSSVDYGSALAVDAGGTAYVTGYTASSDFPRAEPYQATHAGFYDAYLAALAPDGTLKFGTYLGGNGADSGAAVAVSQSGAVFVAGQSLSWNFPVSGAFQPLNPDSYGGFLTKFQIGGRPVVQSVTPASGSGVTQTFSFIITDPDGAADLAWTYVIISPSLSSSNACYFVYSRA
ncbi:MAG: SBBP repeat-containing protein, partial [Acidobacteriales bacterium]|nr:SBBP repeat-containing protein [Terriglobales bacterium]